MAESTASRRVFLLSPARVNGKRAQILMRPEAEFDLAVRLRETGAPLGEVFSFMSGLYFRGKLAYARAFAAPPIGTAGVWVITAGRGLLPPETVVTLADLRAFGLVSVDSQGSAYFEPLKRDAEQLRASLGPEGSAVLLGSVATTKYSEPLADVFGDQLLFPLDFVGRGDLSRGGLLLRAATSGRELPYEPVGRATRHGRRPARLPKIGVV